jgi:hypothetical protein
MVTRRTLGSQTGQAGGTVGRCIRIREVVSLYLGRDTDVLVSDLPNCCEVPPNKWRGTTSNKPRPPPYKSFKQTKTNKQTNSVALSPRESYTD